MKIKLLPFLFVLLLGACSVPKDVTYFQGIDSLTQEQIDQMTQTYTSKIAPNDLLTITVTAWDPTVVTPFNPPAFSFLSEGETETKNTQQLQSYLVFQDGTINFPVLGKVHVAGLSKQQLAEKMMKEIRAYVKDAMVNVQIVNYYVMMMGEVARPGMVTVKNDRVTILDAISRVGELTINANRKNVLIIRDVEGRKEFGRIDLTKTDVFTSPYFYLRQNDIIYVEPNDAKKKNARYSAAQQYTVTVFSSIMSAISIITTVTIALITLNK